MGIFGSKTVTRTLVSLRPCHCGEMSYGTLKVVDAVHCNYCGATYLISISVDFPVAKYEMVVKESEEGK